MSDLTEESGETGLNSPSNIAGPGLDDSGATETDTTSALVRQLPPLWIGIAYVLCSFVFLGIRFALHPGANQRNALLLISVPAFFYYLWCVFKIFSILGQVPKWRCPVSASGAVVRHFIPLYNLYFIYLWIGYVAEFTDWQLQRNALRHGLVASLLILSFLLRFYDISLGSLAVFATMYLIYRPLRNALRAPRPEGSIMPSYEGTLGLS